MRQQTIFAMLLIALGIAALMYQGVTYKTREKAVDLGELQITREKTNTIPIPPVAGALAIIGGVILLIKNRQKNAL